MKPETEPRNHSFNGYDFLKRFSLMVSRFGSVSNRFGFDTLEPNRCQLLLSHISFFLSFSHSREEKTDSVSNRFGFDTLEPNRTVANCYSFSVSVSLILVKRKQSLEELGKSPRSSGIATAAIAIAIASAIIIFTRFNRRSSVGLFFFFYLCFHGLGLTPQKSSLSLSASSSPR